MMIPVEGHSNLYRDENTGAILNFDSISYNQYINSVNNRDKQKKELEQMKNDINEIKDLLKELLNGSK